MDLARRNKVWNVTVTVIPIIIGVLGITPKNPKKEIE